MSSPHYPQSNGKAESALKSMKKLISASWTGNSVDWNKLPRTLLQYRNTPCRKDGRSPAQKLFGHPVQDTLPAHRRSFAPEWQQLTIEADKKLHETQDNSTRIYNQQAHTLPDLETGNHVAIQNPTTKLWDTYGTITGIGPYRKYFVKTQSGSFCKEQTINSKKTPHLNHCPLTNGNCTSTGLSTSSKLTTQCETSVNSCYTTARVLIGGYRLDIKLPCTPVTGAWRGGVGTISELPEL